MSAPLVQELVFKTKAELAGAKAAEDALQREIGKLKALGDSSKEAEAKLAALQARMKNSTGPAGGGFFGGLKDAASSIPGVGSVLSALATPVGAAVAGFSALIGVMAKAREEFAANQESVFKLDAALAQNQLLTDATREKYAALADELETKTAISGEKWLDVLTRLTQFGANPDQIEQYTEAVKNLAGIMGGDVESAAAAVSKAMQGNFTMFSRYGIVVSEAGTQTEKMATLMEDLAQRGGGQLEARAQSLNGHWAQMKLQLGNVLENIGRFINDGQETGGVVGGLARTFAWWAEVTGGTTKKLDGMANALTKTKESGEELAGQKAKLDAVLTGIGTAAAASSTNLQKLVTDLDDAAAHVAALATAENALALAELEIWKAQNPDDEIAYLERKATLQKEIADELHRQADALSEAKQKAAQDAINFALGQEGDLAESVNERAPKIAQARKEQKELVEPAAAMQRMVDEDKAAIKKIQASVTSDRGQALVGSRAYELRTELAETQQKLLRDQKTRNESKAAAAGKGLVDGQPLAAAEATQADEAARLAAIQKANEANLPAHGDIVRGEVNRRERSAAVKAVTDRTREASTQAAVIKAGGDFAFGNEPIGAPGVRGVAGVPTAPAVSGPDPVATAFERLARAMAEKDARLIAIIMDEIRRNEELTGGTLRKD